MDLRNPINLGKLRNIAIASIASSKSVPDLESSPRFRAGLNIAGESQAFHRFQEEMKRKLREREGLPLLREPARAASIGRAPASGFLLNLGADPDAVWVQRRAKFATANVRKCLLP
jgi:hypothetical protein